MGLKRLLLTVVVVIVLIAGVLVYLNYTYFFFPLLYRADNITYLPFDWYKKPMSYDFLNFDNDKISGKGIKSEEDIRFIYSELKKSKILGPVSTVKKSEINIPNEFIGVIVINSSYQGRCTVNTINWAGNNSNICMVSGMYNINGRDIGTDLYVEMTKALKDFINSKLEGV